MVQIHGTNLYKIVCYKILVKTGEVIKSKTLFKRITKPEADDKLFRLERNLSL